MGAKPPFAQLYLLLTEDGHRITTFATIKIVDDYGVSSFIIDKPCCVVLE